MSVRLEVPADVAQRIVDEARVRNIDPQKLLGQVLFTGLSSLAGQSEERNTLLQELRTQPVPQTLADLKPRIATPSSQSPIAMIVGQWPGEETEAELLAVQVVSSGRAYNSPTAALFAQWALEDITDDPAEIAQRQRDGDELLETLKHSPLSLHRVDVGVGKSDEEDAA